MESVLFILSLPRSGSTLLQRILATSDQINTSAEPWVLLPHIYTLKSEGTISEFATFNFYTARNDFYQELPNGKSDYEEALSKFVSDLYGRLCKNEKYFLDKTPRYHLIAEELHQVFPNAKFIYLVRNPLSVYGSIIQTFCQNKLYKLFNFHIDLYQGPQNILRAYRKNSNNSILVHYENIVNNPNKEIARIADYLDLPFESFNVEKFSEVNFSGRFGDPTGIKKYQNVDSRSAKDSSKTFNNIYRQIIARKYLKKLGSELLEGLGYDDQVILDEMKFKFGNIFKIIQDITFFNLSKIVRIIKPNIHFGKIKVWSSNRFLS